MVWAIGLMSGTSADGVDAALLLTDGEARVETGAALTIPYDAALRARLRGLDADDGAAVAEVERLMTDDHAAAVAALLAQAPAAPAVIGFHGHTLFHRPDLGLTRQIGDGARLAAATGIDVVADLRAADMRAGGQGAPLAPVYHRALAAGLKTPLAVLNVGGVANVTWIGGAGDDALIGFDTGPGNALLDDWALSHTGRPLDEDGRLAAAGAVDQGALSMLLADPYFAVAPPKSLDRDHFAGRAETALAGLAAADGAATLLAFTAVSVAAAAAHFPAPARRWLVCGGGRRNPALMAALAERLAEPVAAVETVGWNGDALEAQAFAYLAVRSRRGLPLTFPGTTGAAAPTPGGVLHRAPGRQD